MIIAHCSAFIYEEHDFNMSDGNVQCSVKNGHIFVNGIYKGELNAYGAQLLNAFKSSMQQWTVNLQQNMFNNMRSAQNAFADSNWPWSRNAQFGMNAFLPNWPRNIPFANGALAYGNQQQIGISQVPVLPAFCYS
ncbi:hypothetical protein Tcan_03744 [Toxocara canis]|nr:hypothetical protein Tcan_03744 [Toxocara canis]